MPTTHHQCCCVSCAIGPHECLQITLSDVTTRCIASVAGGVITWATSGPIVEPSSNQIWNHWPEYVSGGGSTRGTRANATVNGLATSATLSGSAFYGTMSDGTALDVDPLTGLPDGTSPARVSASISKQAGACELVLNVWEGTQDLYYDSGGAGYGPGAANAGPYLLMNKVYRHAGTVDMAALRSTAGVELDNAFTALPTSITGYGDTGGDGFGITGYGGKATVRITTCGDSCWKTTTAECDPETGVWTKTAALTSTEQPPRPLNRWIRDNETGIWYRTEYMGPTNAGDCIAYSDTPEASDPPACIGGAWYVKTNKVCHASGGWITTVTGSGTYDHPPVVGAWFLDGGEWWHWKKVGDYVGAGDGPWVASPRIFTPEMTNPPTPCTPEPGTRWCLTQTLVQCDPFSKSAESQIRNDLTGFPLNVWYWNGNAWLHFVAESYGGVGMIGEPCGGSAAATNPPECGGGFGGDDGDRCWHVTVWEWIPAGEFNPPLWMPAAGTGPQIAAPNAFSNPGTYVYYVVGGTCYARHAVNYGPATTHDDCVDTFIMPNDPPAEGCP